MVTRTALSTANVVIDKMCESLRGYFFPLSTVRIWFYGERLSTDGRRSQHWTERSLDNISSRNHRLSKVGDPVLTELWPTVFAVLEQSILKRHWSQSDAPSISAMWTLGSVLLLVNCARSILLLALSVNEGATVPGYRAAPLLRMIMVFALLPEFKWHKKEISWLLRAIILV